MADIASTTYNCWSCRHIEAKETSVETEVFVDRETSEELSDREQSETTESANKVISLSACLLCALQEV